MTLVDNSLFPILSSNSLYVTDINSLLIAWFANKIVRFCSIKYFQIIAEFLITSKNSNSFRFDTYTGFEFWEGTVLWQRTWKGKHWLKLILIDSYNWAYDKPNGNFFCITDREIFWNSRNLKVVPHLRNKKSLNSFRIEHYWFFTPDNIQAQPSFIVSENYSFTLKTCWDHAHLLGQ